MIDPYAVTDFRRSDADLEEFWIFCVSVAGKKATMIAPKVHGFLEGCGLPGTPFERVRGLLARGDLVAQMRRVGLGKYALLSRSLEQVVTTPGLDVRTSPVADLEAVHGVGQKTARFFVVHSREGVRHAVIDTHMLKHLRRLGHEAPAGVPSGRAYYELEKVVLAEADRAGLTPHDFDLRVWSAWSSARGGEPDFAAWGLPAPDGTGAGA